MNNYIQTYEDFLFENLSYTFGIKQKNVTKTLEHFKKNVLPILRLNEDDIAVIGSAGKKKNPDDVSYNINIGINQLPIMKYNANVQKSEYVLQFIQNQINRLGYSSKILAEKNQLNVNWPINGNKKNGFVELHLKVTDNLDWLKWSRYSDVYKPDNRFLPKHRELLFESIAENIKNQILEYFDNKSNVKTYSSFIFEADDGLFAKQYTFMGKNGILKYPIELLDSKQLISKKPKEVTELLFGKNVKPEDIVTFEKAYSYFMSESFPYKKKRKRILETLKKKLSAKNLELPDVIK